jgi:hypothetical protein
MFSFVSSVLKLNNEKTYFITDENYNTDGWLVSKLNNVIPTPSISYRLIYFIRYTVDVYRMYLF